MYRRMRMAQNVKLIDYSVEIESNLSSLAHRVSCFMLVSCRFVVALELFNFSLVFHRISRQ